MHIPAHTTFRRKPAKTAAVLRWDMDETQLFGIVRTGQRSARRLMH